ncbi:hypothetical protein HO173_004154 [Letharia columbiana]|uniref:Uncharacterized protein n=1 Tax=Letharia columbiana TaxID=112416 RepID=A0A8H6L6X3_9LECA|nr:uncharacterized protein HO173_004154 [Letharia columbiana]KAF6237953.1 hypothetical protein HO173_004154 [Letharia columbiana]
MSQVLGQTISIGTDFITSTASASSAQLTGVSCAIHIYPNGDFGLDMSDGLRDQIQTIKSSATNGTSVETKIQNAIIAANYNIQKKQLGSAALAEGAFILGTISYLFNSHPAVPIHVQILSEDVAQMSSAQAAFANPTVMYIETASAGPVATVLLADSSPTVAPSVAVSSAASCPSQIVSGDLVRKRDFVSLM